MEVLDQTQTQVQILDQMSNLGPTPEEVTGLFLEAPPPVPRSPSPIENI